MRHSSPRAAGANHPLVASSSPHRAAPHRRGYHDANCILVMAGVTSLMVYNPLLVSNLNPSDKPGLDKNRKLRRPRDLSWHHHPRTVLSYSAFNATIPPPNQSWIISQFENDTMLYDTALHYKNYTDDFMPTMDGVPLFDESCVPIKSWQVAYYPTCNIFHSQDYTTMRLLGIGSARIVWKLGEEAALKMTKLHHVEARKSLYESWRMDAMISERLTSSPRVLDIYGHCGLATFNQVGIIDPQWYKQHHQSLADKMWLALELARALADVHSIDGNDTVTAVWHNMKPENVLFVGNQLKITDFDESILLRWHNSTKKTCKFHLANSDPKRYQPIELSISNNNLDEKVDIYSLGAMLYTILVGGRPYDQAHHFQLKTDGVLPEFPTNLQNDTISDTLRTLTIQCMTKKAGTRPSAQQVVHVLEQAVHDT